MENSKLETVLTALDTKMTEKLSTFSGDIDALTAEITVLKGKLSATDSMSNVDSRKKVVVDAFKMVKEGEAKDFASALDSHFLNETTATEGKELVIAEFAREIFQAMKEYATVDNKDVRFTSSAIYNYRKYVNGSTTEYVATGTAPTFSKGQTDVISITPADAKTAVKVEDNLIDDVTETYNVIVKDISESQALFVNAQTFLWNGIWLNRTWVLENADIVEVNSPETTLAGLSATQLDNVLDAITLALPIEYENGAKWYVSKYELSILKKARDNNGNKLYQDLEWTEKMLKGFPLVVMADKKIKTSVNDDTGVRGLLLANFKAYAEIVRKDVNIQKMYLASDQAAGIATILATARHSGKVVDPNAFVVSKNA